MILVCRSLILLSKIATRVIILHGSSIDITGKFKYSSFEASKINLITTAPKTFGISSNIYISYYMYNFPSVKRRGVNKI